MSERNEHVVWLEAKLKVALDREEYVEAARLRDELHQLAGAEGVSERLSELTTNWATRSAPEQRIALGSLWQEDSELVRRVDSPRLPDLEEAKSSPVKRLPGFLSESDLSAIHAAASAVREAKGTAAQNANCLERTVREGGRTVFVNEALWQMLPGLYERIVAAARAADAELWGGVLAGRHGVSLRSAEYHVVTAEGGLPMPCHVDHGSLITVDLMLSDSADYEGGAFRTLEPDGSLATHSFERGDALLLLSHKHHAVDAVTAGIRNILVLELWEGLPRRCPQRCDQPWMPCYCAYRPFDLYTRHSEAHYTPIGLSDIERLRMRGLAVHAAATQRIDAEGVEASATKGQDDQDEELLAWARRRREQRESDERADGAASGDAK